jgi:transposase-like protein
MRDIDLTNPIFHDEDKACEHLEAQRWPDGPFCPHCGEAENVHRLQGKSHRPGLFQCNSCLQTFTVMVGSVFESSHIPLTKWVLAFHLIAASKKGMSALQLQRMLGLGSYRSAWFMCHRVREAMTPAEWDFKWNTRKMSDGERAALAVKGAEGKRLTYRNPH